MEFLSYRKSTAVVALALSGIVLAGCEIDSYLTDASDVQCDGKRTKVDLAAEDTTSFIVHGKENGDVATIKVRRNEQGVSVAVSGDVTGPPQQVEADGYTAPLPVVDGSELTTFGAGGGWVIDVRKDSVVIQGSCDGM